ncbi:Phosphatidylinositol 3-kinase catalytic subunit type 3 [Chamberlinius hualienensis]
MSSIGIEIGASDFHYVYSCDLQCNLQIMIGNLEGKRDRPSHQALINDPLLKFSGVYKDGFSELYVTCQVFTNGNPLALPVRTSYKYFNKRWEWNEWLTLPVKYSDLPRNAMLTFTIWDCYGPRRALPIGGTTVPLFGKHGVLRQGIHDLKVWPDVLADGRMNTTTPGKHDVEKDQTSRLAKLKKKHRNGQMVKVDWLDRLTFREIETISDQEKRVSNCMFLMIEFPQIQYEGLEYSVVYFEKDGNDSFPIRSNPEIVTVSDPEIGMENLIESKHHKLARRSRLSDKDLKPNAETRDQLNVIVGFPSTKLLTSEQQDLVWKFRFYLSNQKKALTKFLKCVNWNVAQEVRQAIDQLHRWAPMDVEDALELLSPQFTHPAVRRYAVTRLRQAPDEDLLLYLLQLVQALKYENVDMKESDVVSSRRDLSLQADMELSAPSRERVSLNLHSESSVENISEQSAITVAEHVREGSPDSDLEIAEYDLATFLINRSCANFTLANYFFWYLHVECESPEHASKDPVMTEMYRTVMRRFSQSLMKGGRELRLWRSQLVGQQAFIEKLVTLVKTIAREKGDRKKKVERLHTLLSDPIVNKFNFANFEPLPLPLDPEVKVKGILHEKATLFKSALMPCRLTFLTTDDAEYVTIFKHGDDLRQDQLILQIIILMDKLLRRENLDLKLTPYRVMATSSKHGFVQFIESTSIAEVLANEGSIQNFFRKHSASETGPYGISTEIMESYVKSCAGYCVITYLLGVGDRHFDNLLLTKTGKLFHIDFGYILGRDPKPMPPPMKLSKEMVEAMGSVSSEHYQEFRKQCYTAFLHLRRHANLILNLFSLMVDANVPDIALEPDKTVKKVQDKFRLDLTDEEAVHYMQNLIDDSVSSVMPALVEQIHKIAQYWRK